MNHVRFKKTEDGGHHADRGRDWWVFAVSVVRVRDIWEVESGSVLSCDDLSECHKHHRELNDMVISHGCVVLGVLIEIGMIHVISFAGLVFGEERGKKRNGEVGAGRG